MLVLMIVHFPMERNQDGKIAKLVKSLDGSYLRMILQARKEELLK